MEEGIKLLPLDAVLVVTNEVVGVCNGKVGGNTETALTVAVGV